MKTLNLVLHLVPDDSFFFNKSVCLYAEFPFCLTVLTDPDSPSAFLCPIMYPRTADTSDYHPDTFAVWIPADFGLWEAIAYLGNAEWRRQKSNINSFFLLPLCCGPHL